MRKTQPRFAPGAAGTVLVGLMLGCTAGKEPSKVETALANMAKDVAIPIQAGSLTNPVPASDETVKKGQQLYAQSCAVCHGSDGRGRTDLGRNMYPPAMDLNSPHVQHWTDAELFWIIQNGVRLTGMPSWKAGLSEGDTWKVVDFLRSLPRQNATRGASATPAPGGHAAESPADLIAYGRTLYRQEGCFTCHRLDGEGTGVGPDLSTEGTRGRSDDWLIGHFKDPPRYTPGSVMPPFVNLSDAQLRALTALLQNQRGPNEK